MLTSKRWRADQIRQSTCVTSNLGVAEANGPLHSVSAFFALKRQGILVIWACPGKVFAGGAAPEVDTTLVPH